jgi:signal transduction histidine kinase/DNA-binding response OmpR family regulator
MLTPLRVLIIEDSQDDEQLLLRELQRIGYDVEFERVETAEAMQAALSHKTWDVILSDYSLPRFDAPQALEVMKASGLDLPFIIISGTIGEDTAVAALKAGAHDFHVKGKFARLGPAIKRELSEAETRRKHKQAEAQIQFQLQRLKGLREIDMAISSSFDINVTLDIILQQVVLQLNVDAAAILLFDPYTQNLEYIGGRGFHSDALIHSQFKLNESFASRALLERQIFHNPDLLRDRGKISETLQQLVGKDFVDYYGIPLLAKTGVKGVLEIFHRSPLHLKPEWMEFVETLAGEAAIAIDSAQLFDGLQRANNELEQRVEERTRELIRANAKLEHANRIKDEFLATMSHELRTPLNSILGMSELLLEQRRDPLSAQQQRALSIVESSGRHLLELINDILDVSKIEAGKLVFHPETVEIAQICQASLTFVKTQAMKKSIKLTLEKDKTVSKIHADPQRLKQILINLLTNAVKFTPDHGQVTLEVQADADQDLIQFHVIDTGIGIAVEDLKQLFQPFVQVESKLNRKFEGTGLGLALVQKLTDLQGGSVDVESTVGKGSRFTINLKMGQAFVARQETLESQGSVGESQAADPAEKSLDHGTVLLAEDNLSNVLTMGDYLMSHGYQVAFASDGLEAIAKAIEIQPDIILMDIQMPVVDGLEAIGRLRSDPRFISTPIIALTALAMPGDRERCLEAGANEYLSKPVGLKELVKTIKSFVQPKNRNE